MKKFGVLMGVVLLLLTPAETVFSATWVVDPGGGGSFTTIQDCIDDPLVVDGDVCLVKPGTFTENIIVPWEKLNLDIISTDGPAATIIDGGGAGHVIFYEDASATETILDGFTVRNGGDRGIYCPFRGPTIMNCIITENTGGGIFSQYGSISVYHSIITANGNAMTIGGGILLNEGSNAKIVNCIIGNNLADKGGGLYGDEHDGMKVTNCTFAYNNATSYGGGIVSASDSSVNITNSILWSNTAPEGAQLWIGYLLSSGSSATVSFSDIELKGEVAGIYVEPDPGNTLNWGPGNIDKNPLFVGPGDLHLLIGSPCIDAGNNLAPDLPTEDIDGDSRIMDGNGDGQPVVDMGADEARCFISVLSD